MCEDDVKWCETCKKHVVHYPRQIDGETVYLCWACFLEWQRKMSERLELLEE